MNMVASTNITVKFTVTTWTPSFVAINWNWSYGLEEEGLEVVGHVGDDDEEQGGDVDSEDGSQQSSGLRFLENSPSWIDIFEDQNNCFLFKLFDNLLTHYLLL